MSSISCRLGIGLGCTTGAASDNSVVATLGIGIGHAPGISSNTNFATLEVLGVGSGHTVSVLLWVAVSVDIGLALQTLPFAKQALYKAR